MQHKSFDDVLQERVGFGKYQYRVYGIVGFIDFVDGIEAMFAMFLPAIMQQEMGLQDWQVELLGSLYFIGAFFGYFFSGILCDRLGRKDTMLIGNSLALLTFIFTAFAKTYVDIVIVRLLYGLVIAMTAPVSYLLISEMTPKHLRGRTQVLLQFFYIAGKMYLLWMMSLFMTSLVEGDWRKVALASAVPCLLMLLGNVFLLQESPRLLVMQGNFEQAEAVINSIGYTNLQQKYQIVSQKERDQLKQWRDRILVEAQQKQGMDAIQSLKTLFQKQRLPVTWRLLVFNSLLSFAYSGLYFLTPFLFSTNHQNGLFEIFLTTLAEVPAVAILVFIIDDVRVGRVRMLVGSQSIVTLIFFALYVFKDPFLLIGIMILKFFLRIQAAISMPVMTESYSTLDRAMALAMLGSSGRIFSAVTPFVIFGIYRAEAFLPFLLMSALQFLATLTMCSYPVELTGRELDNTDVLYQTNLYRQLPQSRHDVNGHITDEQAQAQTHNKNQHQQLGEEGSAPQTQPLLLENAKPQLIEYSSPLLDQQAQPEFIEYSSPLMHDREKSLLIANTTNLSENQLEIVAPATNEENESAEASDQANNQDMIEDLNNKKQQ